MRKFTDFLGSIFKQGKIYNVKDPPEADAERAEMQMTAFAATVAVDLISGLISKCEFKTLAGNRENKANDYILWNLTPNSMQSGAEFKKLLVEKLLAENEVLIIQSMDSLFLAESFTVQQEYLKFPASYKDVEVKTEDGSLFNFGRTFTASEVIHIRLNDNNITALLSGLENSYNRLLNYAVRKYKRSEGRKGVISLDRNAGGNEEQKEKEQALIRSGFKKYYEDENGLVILPRSMTYTETQSNSGKMGSEVTNLTTLTKECFTRAAQAYKVPPSLLIGEVADTSKAMDQLLTVCIDPLVALITTEINRKYYGDKVMNGWKIVVDTTQIKHIDIFDISTAVDKLLSSGYASIDELRVLSGMLPLNTDWSRKHWMTKNYTEIAQAGGTDPPGGEGK